MYSYSYSTREYALLKSILQTVRQTFKLLFHCDATKSDEVFLELKLLKACETFMGWENPLNSRFIHLVTVTLSRSLIILYAYNLTADNLELKSSLGALCIFEMGKNH